MTQPCATHHSEGRAHAPRRPPRPAPCSARARRVTADRRDVRREPPPPAPAGLPDAERELAPRPPAHAVGRASWGSECLGSLLLLDVDVVPDHATEDSARGGPDDTALHLVATRGGTDDRTRGSADGRITLGVLRGHDARRGRDGASTNPSAPASASR